MNPLDDLTVCITSYQREFHLERAIESARKAGIRRLVVATAAPTAGILAILEKQKDGWLSYDVAKTQWDIGCNNTWALAAYHSRTERILILHDDDVIMPEFGEAYDKKISRMLDAGVGFASWRANHIMDDGSTHKTEYFYGPTRVVPSIEIERRVVARFGGLSLSPIVSVLDRTTVIHACKEAEETLTHNDCLYRPGMLLGTEILVYMRHIKKSPSWYYVDELLTMYGAHGGSGTIEMEAKGNIAPLVKGYDRARVQGVMRRAPTPKPKIILVHGFTGAISDADEERRLQQARFSRNYHFANFSMVDREIRMDELKRTSADLGDNRPAAYVKDYLDVGCAMALPEDIVAFTNSDIGLTTEAADRLIAGVERGRGATVCPRRMLTHPELGRLYRTVRNCKADGGMDVIAVSPHWWELIKDAFPDMLIGREAWDLCFRTVVEEWVDGPVLKSTMNIPPEDWWISRAYTDDVCWHEPHDSMWKLERLTNVGGAHNRKLAREFYEARRNLMGLACVSEPVNKRVEGPLKAFTVNEKPLEPSDGGKSLTENGNPTEPS